MFFFSMFATRKRLRQLQLRRSGNRTLKPCVNVVVVAVFLGIRVNKTCEFVFFWIFLMKFLYKTSAISYKSYKKYIVS